MLLAKEHRGLILDPTSSVGKGLARLLRCWGLARARGAQDLTGAGRNVPGWLLGIRFPGGVGTAVTSGMPLAWAARALA